MKSHTLLCGYTVNKPLFIYLFIFIFNAVWVTDTVHKSNQLYRCILCFKFNMNTGNKDAVKTSVFTSFICKLNKCY